MRFWAKVFAALGTTALVVFLLGIFLAENLETPPLLPPPLTSVVQPELGAHTVVEMLANITDAGERATVKGQEIAKIGPQPRQNVQFSGADYDIEIVSLTAIEGGIEVLARAWNPDGSQIGFGKNGTVDIERFKFQITVGGPYDNLKNLVVQDDVGDISVDYDVFDDQGVKIGVETVKYREDPLEVVLRLLSSTIEVKKQKFGAENIQPLKVGSTTSTFYPVAGQNSPVDGGTLYNDFPDWDTVHDAAEATHVFPTDASIYAARCLFIDPDYAVYRTVFLFNTASIGTDAIASAIFSVKSGASNFSNDDSDTLTLVSSNPANNDDVVVGDYDSYGTTSFGSSALSNRVSLAYFDVTVNGTGRAAINKSGITKFGTRTERDIADNAPTGNNSMQIFSADQADVTSDPKLVVEHAESVDQPYIFYN